MKQMENNKIFSVYPESLIIKKESKRKQLNKTTQRTSEILKITKYLKHFKTTPEWNFLLKRTAQE